MVASGPLVWVAFNLFVLAMLALDLFVFHRRAHEVRTREAATWSAVWIALALAFSVGLYRVAGEEAALMFLAGYLVEKALSVDNVFVFVLIFSYFRIPARYQHRVLFWGILGALVTRGTMIAAGAYLVRQFEWVLYGFGAFLVATGVRMATHDDRDLTPESNVVIRLVTRFVRVTTTYDGQRFLTRVPAADGGTRRAATPLLLALVMVETTDVIFAVDSIPAIFAITTDPFIVYASNVFAILGLRALYFLLARVIHELRHLKTGLSGILVFVGVKMLIADFYHVPIGASLAIIGAILTAAIAASLLWPGAGDHAPRQLEAGPEPRR